MSKKKRTDQERFKQCKVFYVHENIYGETYDSKDSRFQNGIWDIFAYATDEYRFYICRPSYSQAALYFVEIGPQIINERTDMNYLFLKAANSYMLTKPLTKKEGKLLRSLGIDTKKLIRLPSDKERMESRGVL